MMITLDILGSPVAKGRPKHRIVNTRGGKSFSQTYTPAETRQAEFNFRTAALMSYRDQYGQNPTPITGPLSVELTFYQVPPKSLLNTKAKRETNPALMASGALCPTGKPDLDNLCKLAFDALNGIFWLDDAQIVLCLSHKRYADTPRTVITIADSMVYSIGDFRQARGCAPRKAGAELPEVTIRKSRGG